MSFLISKVVTVCSGIPMTMLRLTSVSLRSYSSCNIPPRDFGWLGRRPVSEVIQFIALEPNFDATTDDTNSSRDRASGPHDGLEPEWDF